MNANKEDSLKVTGRRSRRAKVSKLVRILTANAKSRSSADFMRNV